MGSINKEQSKEINRRFSTGESLKDLANDFKVHATTIRYHLGKTSKTQPSLKKRLKRKYKQKALFKEIALSDGPPVDSESKVAIIFSSTRNIADVMKGLFK